LNKFSSVSVSKLLRASAFIVTVEFLLGFAWVQAANVKAATDKQPIRPMVLKGFIILSFGRGYSLWVEFNLNGPLGCFGLGG